MKSSSRTDITGEDISKYIQSHGYLNELHHPCIYIPDVLENGYEYYEDDSGGNEGIKTALPFGINKNKYLDDLLYVLVMDHNSTNAIATMMELLPIVGVYTGSIINIAHNANLMIGTMYESDFDTSRYNSYRVFVENDGVLAFESKNNLLGLKDERILSHIMAEAALRFLVLHEIGHHKEGHITDLTKQENFILLKGVGSGLSSDKEIEADIYAAKMLVEEFELLVSGLEKNISDLSDIGISSPLDLEVCALKMIVYAITLSFSTLCRRKDLLDITKLMPIAKREIYALLSIAIGLYSKCKRAVLYDLCSVQDLSKKEQRKISRELNIDIKQITAKGSIEVEEFARYVYRIFFEGKHLYCKVNSLFGANSKNYLQVYADCLSDML